MRRILFSPGPTIMRMISFFTAIGLLVATPAHATVTLTYSGTADIDIDGVTEMNAIVAWAISFDESGVSDNDVGNNDGDFNDVPITDMRVSVIDETGAGTTYIIDIGTTGADLDISSIGQYDLLRLTWVGGSPTMDGRARFYTTTGGLESNGFFGDINEFDSAQDGASGGNDNISSHDSSIAFSASRPLITTTGEQLVMNHDFPNGSETMQLAIAVTSPLASIAFYSNRDGNNEIYVMNAADGSNQTNLTNHPSWDWNKAWSPDETQIAFDSDRDGSKIEIYVMDAADGSNVTRLTNQQTTDWYPAWSPDGTEIAFHSFRDGNFEIYVMNAADGSNQTRLTNHPSRDWYPAWSPDGTQIAFTSNRVFNADIYVMNAADGSNVTNLTMNPFSTDSVPAWSPDGTKIAFTSARDGDLEIYVMNAADGSNQTNLTMNSSSNDELPAWSPDGTQIAFASNRDGGIWEIYVMNAADGSNVTNLTMNNSSDDRGPVWSPLLAPEPSASLLLPAGILSLLALNQRRRERQQ